ncbi:MAG TPA: BMP family ABC transporter substrate-binding protein [Candidatus Avacidaminococcus intestinavium]|uniref:BMP family ABC transporter substrate-binding protein n=1 Tax=Candidatus Avacidaminococcus intestinavium TaxID=2840684 RepID=A0A9D1SLM9_9FIRM|nr:BMP family ABC transporter substrate-binding protein [Candidatus Avacidaminococcus intestinavium]
MKKIFTLIMTVLFSIALLTGCSDEKKETSAKDATAKTKVAFVYVSSAKDGGYSMAHDLGRQYVEKNMPNVEATYMESVPEGADAERVISQLAAQGNKIIFTTSFGYMDPTINVAKKFPDVTFLHCSGYKTADNVGNYFGRMYEARYLTGIVAGKQTTSNVIGYVAAFPIPEVVRGINAFTLGVRSVNPSAKVKVLWTNTWYNPATEKQAALTLLDAGADVIAQHQNTPGPQQAAEEKGKFGIGYNIDMSAAAPNASLTSAIWTWGPYYASTIEQILAGTWKSGAYWGGMQDKLVDLAPFSKAVSEETKQITNDAKAKIIDGSLKVFMGPLKAQDGSIKVPAGQLMTDEELLKFDWFVEGVDASIQ